MFKYPLVTKQTGAEGQKVSKVLVQEAADIAREIYVGLVVDRGTGLPVLMVRGTPVANQEAPRPVA